MYDTFVSYQIVETAFLADAPTHLWGCKKETGFLEFFDVPLHVVLLLKFRVEPCFWRNVVCIRERARISGPI